MPPESLRDGAGNRRLLQLEQCLAASTRRRQPARDRLATLLGEDLTRRLVFALTRSRAG